MGVGHFVLGRLLRTRLVSRAAAGRVVLVAALVGTMLVGSAVRSGAAAPVLANVPVPKLTQIPYNAGSHGYPYDAANPTAEAPGLLTLNLASYGYTEQEYQMSGTTNTYNEAGIWGSNGQWGVSVASSNVPYTTRLLVRYPTDPSKFNGTVIVEWLNDTTGGDQDPVWSEIYNQALSQGYAYVGVTAQNAGMSELKTWDSQRYGALGDSNDGQSYDIFSQASQAVRAESGTLLGGLSPTKVVGVGDSQSAFRVDTYVNAIQPISHAFDGFMAIGRAAFTAPIGSGLVNLFPTPAYIRSDNTTPFFQINTQGDIEELGAGLARQPDTNYLRTWEIAGAAHIDLHEGAYEENTILRENPSLPAPRCTSGVVANNATLPDAVSVYAVEDAALVALQAWMNQGVQPPHGNQISTSFFGTVNLDQYGNGEGGVRMPEVSVPQASYNPINSYQSSSTSLSSVESELLSLFTSLESGAITDVNARDAGLCLLEGYYTPLSTSQLQALYPTHADYVQQFTAAAQADLNAGFLTQQDYGYEVALAQLSTVP
jgi:hypothetical protein